MESRDSDIFKALFGQTAEYYQGRMAGLDIWWAGLRPYSIKQVRSAFDAHIKDPAAGKFPPMVSDVIWRNCGGT